MPNDYYHGRKYVHSPEDLPPGEHHVIIKFGSITIPGDERSRTNPGHGYPEHTLSTMECIAFESREAWEAEVLQLVGAKRASEQWVPLIVRRPTLKTNVTLDIG